MAVKKSVESRITRGPVTTNIVKIPFIVLQRMAYIFYHPKPASGTKKILIFTNIHYAGNPRAVYERIIKRKDLRDKYDAYWMTSNISEFLKLRKQWKNVVYKHGIFSIKVYSRASLWILAHRGPMNLPHILKNRYKEVNKIQLEHGVGPKITKGEDREYEDYIATCLSSEDIKKRHIELWNAPPERLYATGFARLDLLLGHLKRSRDELLEELDLPHEYSKIVLHAPTFDMGLWPWGDPYEGIANMAEFLESQNTMLLIRPHPYTIYDRGRLKSISKKYKNLRFVPMERYHDVEKLLAVTDVLITDWSSTYTDFLVTGRPVVFLDVNRKFFLKERCDGCMPEVPPEMRPGLKVSNEKELRGALKKSIYDGYIPDKEFYMKCLEFIHGNPDGHYSDRVIEVIEHVLR